MGDRFGRYELLRTLGRGGMSWTSLAEVQGPRGFRKRLAIKRLHESLLTSGEARACFDAEARIAGLLEHNHIVRTYEYGDVDDEPYLAFEVVPGLTLEAVLAGLERGDGGMPIGTALHLGRCLALALAHAHEVRDPNGRATQITHRDVNPSNTLVSWQGAVKLADFGVARHSAATLAAIPGAVRGRFAYMAPEQAEQPSPDARADVFSLGAVLYRCLAGRDAFSGLSSVEDLRQAHLRGVAPLRALRPQTPLFLSELIMSSLARHPADRPASARAVARHLQAVSRRIVDACDDLALADLLGTLRHRWQAGVSTPVAGTQAATPAGGPERPPTLAGMSVPGARLAVLASTPGAKRAELDPSTPCPHP